MHERSLGFMSIIRSILMSAEDLKVSSVVAKCCMKPDQFGLGSSSFKEIKPACQARSRFREGGKTYAVLKCAIGLKCN